MPVSERMKWIAPGELALVRQCDLAGVSRSCLYARQKEKPVDEEELVLLTEIDAEYTRHPFYGSRRMTVWLRSKGYQINRKRVRRLMGILCLVGMAPGPATSKPHPAHKAYPYLLRGMEM